jgi:PAS domain S-box-containing protein
MTTPSADTFAGTGAGGSGMIPPQPGTDQDERKNWTQFQLLSAIVNSSDDAIVGKSCDGVITSWNPAAERLYGYSAREIIGQPMTLLCPPDRIGEISEILARISRGEPVSHHETVRQRKDGTTFPVSVTVSPVRDREGRLIGASSIARDITRELQIRSHAQLTRRAADLQLANRNLERFTYSVAHDLRAPLRTMSGFSTALLEECRSVLSDECRVYAERIVAASEHMATVIDDLLRLSHVSQVAMELQRDEPGRRAFFTIERPALAQADRVLIHGVLRELLENAWKFTSTQEEASIEFGMTAAGESPAWFYVRDNGVGFDPRFTGQLFSQFQRLHPAGEFPGTGAGLATVRQIVERHGGQVRAEGAVGRGATFSFTLDAEEIT